MQAIKDAEHCTSLECTPQAAQPVQFSQAFCLQLPTAPSLSTLPKLSHETRFAKSMSTMLPKAKDAGHCYTPAPCKRGGHKALVLKKPSSNDRHGISELLGNLRMTLGKEKSYFTGDLSDPKLIVEFSKKRFHEQHHEYCKELFKKACTENLTRAECIEWRNQQFLEVCAKNLSICSLAQNSMVCGRH